MEKQGKACKNGHLQIVAGWRSSVWLDDERKASTDRLIKKEDWKISKSAGTQSAYFAESANAGKRRKQQLLKQIWEPKQHSAERQM